MHSSAGGITARMEEEHAMSIFITCGGTDIFYKDWGAGNDDLRSISARILFIHPMQPLVRMLAGHEGGPA